MYFIILAFVIYVSACDVANNVGVGGVNPDCNWAGYCERHVIISICQCCEPWIANDTLYPESSSNCGEEWVCDPENPTEQCYFFSSTSCTKILKYPYLNIGFRLAFVDMKEEPDINCNTDPYRRSTYNEYLNLTVSLQSQVNWVATVRGWPQGSFVIEGPCDTCSVEYPCTQATNPNLNIVSGIAFGCQVQFNSYYNESCQVANYFTSVSDVPECEYNFDYGIKAKKAFDVVFHKEGFLSLFQDLITTPPSSQNRFLGLGWNNTILVGMGEEAPKIAEDFKITTSAPTRTPSVEPTAVPTETPTMSPSSVPTMSPSAVPTETPTQTPSSVPTETPTQTPSSVPTETPTQTPTVEQCRPYANSIDDMKYIGYGINCRAGLNMSYPGGLSCDSPYIVCLPQENTPAQFGYEPYYSSTHRYSVEECKQECANDQRCLGIEWVPDHDSMLGDCNLIDDIPLEITGINDTNGTALCYEKKDACYPYFEADDLETTMLNCYCPNNRKGFYTKKVKRTVENTRFCGLDTDTEERIKKAQANRMFHLCENWCLFDTENPTEEYWLWDPWKTCWREQEDSSTYCAHIIEDPLTIEMQFLINRRDHFCQLNSNANLTDY